MFGVEYLKILPRFEIWCSRVRISTFSTQLYSLRYWAKIQHYWEWATRYCERFRRVEIWEKEEWKGRVMTTVCDRDISSETSSCCRKISTEKSRQANVANFCVRDRYLLSVIKGFLVRASLFPILWWLTNDSKDLSVGKDGGEEYSARPFVSTTFLYVDHVSWIVNASETIVEVYGKDDELSLNIFEDQSDTSEYLPRLSGDYNSCLELSVYLGVFGFD